jgi:hypothetical protein
MAAHEMNFLYDEGLKTGDGLPGYEECYLNPNQNDTQRLDTAGGSCSVCFIMQEANDGLTAGSYQM